MASLTIELDDEVLERARTRANQQDTSVNALVRDYLETYAGVTREQQEALSRILESARRSKSGSGGQRWTREELYDR